MTWLEHVFLMAIVVLVCAAVIFLLPQNLFGQELFR